MRRQVINNNDIDYMLVKRALVFHEEGFQLPSQISCWKRYYKSKCTYIIHKMKHSKRLNYYSWLLFGFQTVTSVHVPTMPCAFIRAYFRWTLKVIHWSWRMLWPLKGLTCPLWRCAAAGGLVWLPVDANFRPDRKCGNIPGKRRSSCGLSATASPRYENSNRAHSGYGLSLWETTLHCNVVSHWLSPCPEWSLGNYTL